MTNLQKICKFAEFTLNPATRTLFRENVEIKLRDKDFDVLLFLIDSAPKTCSPDEIIETVWDGTSVENNSVEKSIAGIRKGLDDDAKNPRFIKTVRGKGYLFVGDARQKEEQSPKEFVAETEKLHTKIEPKPQKLNPLPGKTARFKIALLCFGIVLFVGLMWWKGSEAWAQYNSKVIFADDFSSKVINVNHWTTNGSSITIVDGIMRIIVDETDNGGIVISSNFSFEPTKPIIIQSRLKVTYNQMTKEKVYFYGSFWITANVYDAKEDFSSLPPIDKYGRGVSYTNYDYIGDGGNGTETIATEGFFLVKPFGRTHEKRSYYDNKIGPRMQPVWEKWFEQKIIYNPINGEMQYFIDGEKKSEYNVGTMPQMENPQMRLYISPAGWWTNHSIEIDYIEITQ